MPHSLRQGLLTKAAPVCVAFLAFSIWAARILGVESPQLPEALLELGKPMERQLTGGETHRFRIDLEQNTYLYIVCHQQGIDLALTLTDPNGSNLAQEDGPGGAWVPEVVALIIKTTGTHRLDITATPGTEPGNYRLQLEEARPAHPGDDLRVQAEDLFTEAMHLQAQETAESRQEAIELYQQSLPLWRELGDIRAEGIVLHEVGYVLSTLGRMEQALQAYEKALPLRRQAGVPGDLATTLNNLGYVNQVLGDRQGALKLHQEALAIRLEIGDRRGEAQSLNNLGNLHDLLGEADRARALLTAALDLWRSAGDGRGEAATLNNLALLEQRLGRHREALRLFWAVLEIYDKHGDPSERAVTLHNIALDHQLLGEWEPALRYYQGALEIEKRTGDKLAEAGTLEILGALYLDMGESASGEDLLRSALEVRLEVGDRPNAAKVLCRLADMSIDQGDLEEGKKLLGRALQVLSDASAPRVEAQAFRGQARILAAMGEPEIGVSRVLKALSLYRKAKDRSLESKALRELGLLFQQSGQNAEAKRTYRESLSVSLDSEDPLGQALSHLGLASIHDGGGELQEALAATDSALIAVESLRTGLENPDLRASFLASRHTAFELAVDLRMRLHQENPSVGYAVAAFELSERSRARSLLELVSAPPSAEPSMRPEALTAPDQAEEDFPGGAVRPVKLEALQRDVLDSRTLLLEYSLGEVRSYLFAVDSESLTSFLLPGRAEIEDRARELRRLLTARNVRSSDEGPGERRARIDSADQRYWIEAAELADTLLGPAASRLQDHRLVIVADGALHYLPFAALPDPTLTNETGALTPLVVNHEIVHLPSASVLATMRERRRQRPRPELFLALFADPVFSQEDPRLDRNEDRPMPPPDPATADAVATMSSLLGNGSEGFPRLRFSRREAAAIERLLPEEDVLSAFDFSASREAVVNGGLDRYRIVHFATHGVVSSERPEHSSLVLSLVDRDGHLQDGFLRLPDVYNLKLRADLVVLSACRTAMGREIRGEGIVGLARGFLYAGANRVAATLWDVQDRASGELMRRFYEALLRDKTPASEALRRAQSALWSQERWRSPYYWAGFTLQGEWL